MHGYVLLFLGIIMTSIDAENIKIDAKRTFKTKETLELVY
jgi:hypothetical protein